MNNRHLLPLIFCVPFTGYAGLAVADSLTKIASNDQVLQTYQQGNAGGQQPQLVTQEDGSTRIEWHGGVSVDAYNQNISSGNGSMNTPLRTGNYYRGVIQSDLRGIGPLGDTSYFQLGLTHTDDRAVLSQYPRQINALHIGRVGQGYQVAMGDVAPNFSALSSALAARGALAQIQLGQATVSGYGGVVAESWEALETLVPRNQFLRDVYGFKAEYAFTPGFKAYVTGQSADEREGSITNTTVASIANPAKGRSGTLGFAYQDGPFQVTGETAASHYEQTNADSRSGNASLLDAAWTGQEIALRGGYHDIDAKYTNLISTMATPGIEEVYANADWRAANWISLGADLRNSKFRTLATSITASTTTDTDSGGLRANINFGPEHPGWGLALQHAGSDARESVNGYHSRNKQSSAMLNYSSPTWMAGVGYGFATLRNQASPSTDSNTPSLNVTLGKTWTDANNIAPASWSINTNLSASFQDQKIIGGSSTKNTNYGLNINAQKVDWGTLGISLTSGYLTQPIAGPTLKQRSAQIDASHPFSTQGAFKLYARHTERNVGSETLKSAERLAGAQVTYNF